MMRESESLSIIVRSRLYHLPTLEVMASNDVVLGDKETFAKLPLYEQKTIYMCR